jgi:glycosyltransferase involved in cell wall biosynthesis
MRKQLAKTIYNIYHNDVIKAEKYISKIEYLTKSEIESYQLTKLNLLLENAYIAKPDDVDAFANKLNECLSDPIKASFIGKKGEELVYREFNYLEVTKNIVYSM